MYRQYENPYALERELEQARKDYRKAQDIGADEETLINLTMTIEDLKDRINFAWQDDEET